VPIALSAFVLQIQRLQYGFGNLPRGNECAYALNGVPVRREALMFVPNVPVREGAGLFCGANPQQVAAATILLVEDEDFVREVTCEILRASGYKVLATQNAVEAMKQHEQSNGQIDLLLTDIVLPGESGRVLAERLRKSNPELRVLFVTGYAEQLGLRIRHDCDCLSKPFSSAVLLRRIADLLDRRSQFVGN